MAQLGLTPSEIADVVREQNGTFPPGRVGREPTSQENGAHHPHHYAGRLTEVKDFEEMIVRALPERIHGPAEGCGQD